ncbi:MAG TPA: GNAT family N-acetyltransferase [Solirubrobacterales bacterium]|nr:GNAT family N-acetyltransferase [Solirubrobacterales bacterium]
MSPEVTIRRATAADAGDIGRLLHDFNTEFSEPTPDADVLAERAAAFIQDGTLTFLLAGDGPDGIAQMRYLPSIWSGELDAYLEELYVIPELRGNGIGRALLEAVMETARAAGATHMDLNTGETDTAARALYESTGFTNREGGEDGPSMLYYERDL